jgi:hypothetical protein
MGAVLSLHGWLVRKQNGDVVFWIIFAILVSLAVLHVAVARGLFADGAYFLLQILTTQKFWNYDGVRVIAQVIDQSPVLIAIQAGVTNTKFLARIYTLALELPPLALYLFALWKSRRSIVLFGAFILITVVIYLNLNFMIISEYNLLYALATAALAILLQEDDVGYLDGVLLCVIAVVSTRVYEAMVFLGPMLFAACMLRLFLMKPRPGVIVAIAFAAFWFAFASALAYASILNPRDPANFAGASAIWLVLRDHQLMLTGVLAASFAGYVLFTPLLWRVAMIAVFAAALAALAFPSNWAGPKFHYFSRTGGGLALFGIGVTMILFRFSPWWSSRTSAASLRWPGLLVLGPLAGLIVSSAPDVRNSLGWWRFRHAIQGAVIAKTGILPLNETSVSPADLETFGFSWTFPSMSLLLRRDRSSAIVLNPDPNSWQPFDPRKSVPDLHGYSWK